MEGTNRDYTITVHGTGPLADVDPDVNESNISAFLAGLRAKMHYLSEITVTPSGPEAVDAPALDTSIGGGQVKITNPNFNPEDGVEYFLQYFDGSSWTTIADNQGPNDENYYTYNSASRFRIMAGTTPGPATDTIP